MIKHYLLIFFVLACFLSSATDLFSQESPFSTEQHTDASKENPLDPFNNTPYFSPDHPLKESDNFQAKFMNMLFLLGLIIAFMFFASWFLKRLMRTRLDQLNSTSNIRILETRQLSPRSTLYVIEVLGQHLLIAESHTGVSQLMTFTSDEKQPPENSPHPL